MPTILKHKELFKFARERHRIFLLRQSGKPKPWTKDTILQHYRFTNMYRELDVVTRWIAQHWRMPYHRERHLWFALTIARFLNVPDTLAAIGFPLPWNVHRKAVWNVLKARKEAGEVVFSGAYMVRSDPCPKVDYVVSVFDRLWEDREEIADLIFTKDTKLQEVQDKLVPYYGIGSFMAGQVIADLKYVAPLSNATDWETFAGSGPGSRRGMNRVVGMPIQSPWNEAEWHKHLMELRERIAALCRKVGMPVPHAQDLQGWLCEWDKYERTRLGEGRPRSLYPGV